MEWDGTGFLMTSGGGIRRLDICSDSCLGLPIAIEYIHINMLPAVRVHKSTSRHNHNYHADALNIEP